MSKRDDHLDDNDIEVLLARRSVAPDSGLADLTDVINEIGTTFTVLPEPASTERLLGRCFLLLMRSLPRRAPSGRLLLNPNGGKPC